MTTFSRHDVSMLAGLVRRDLNGERRRYWKPRVRERRERYLAANPGAHDADAVKIAVLESLLDRLEGALRESAVVVAIDRDVAAALVAGDEDAERDVTALVEEGLDGLVASLLPPAVDS